MSRRNIKILLSIAILLFSSLVVNFSIHGKGDNSPSGKKKEFNCIKSDKDCQEKYILNYYKNKTTLETLERLKRLIDQGKIGDCHNVSHVLGEETYYRYKAKKEDKLLYGDLTYICTIGYLHGILASAGKEKDTEFVNFASKNLCRDQDFTVNKIFQLSGCLHGIGHSYYQTAIPLKDVLSLCNQLVENYKFLTPDDKVTLKYRCDNGYAMQALEKVKPEEDMVTTKDVERICQPYQDILCNLAFMRNILEKYQISLNDAKIKAEDMHQYCESGKFTGVYKVICENNIGETFIDHYKENPEPEVLAAFANEICQSSDCMEVALIVNSAHGVKTDADYANRLCSRLKYLDKSKCIDRMLVYYNKQMLGSEIK